MLRFIIAALTLLVAFAAAPQAARAQAPVCEMMLVAEWLEHTVILYDENERHVGVISASDLTGVTTVQFCSDKPAFARVRINGQTRLVHREAIRVRPTIAPPRRPPPPPESEASRDDGVMERARPSRGAGGVARERVLTPVLVELPPDQARLARQGGSAVVLLGDPAFQAPARRNLALCQALFVSFDQARSNEIGPGVRVRDGEVQLLRPLYWLTRSVTENMPGASACPQRLQNYDFARGERIKRKFRLTGPGPYLVVERADQSQTERVAAIIDLSTTRPQDVAELVRYFHEGFMQRGDVWSPARYEPQRARGDLLAFFGHDVEFGALPRLIRVTQQVGCPLANLFDICEAPN